MVVLFLGGLAALGVGTWEYLGALANLRPDHPTSYARILMVQKIWAGKENFTERGGKLLWRARIWYLLGVLLFIAGARLGVR